MKTRGADCRARSLGWTEGFLRAVVPAHPVPADGLLDAVGADLVELDEGVPDPAVGVEHDSIRPAFSDVASCRSCGGGGKVDARCVRV